MSLLRKMALSGLGAVAGLSTAGADDPLLSEAAFHLELMNLPKTPALQVESAFAPRGRWLQLEVPRPTESIPRLMRERPVCQFCGMG